MRWPTLSSEERFWSKVTKADGCWLWNCGLDAYGYGQFKMDGTNRKSHRVSYELLIGPIPSGMHIDHICHNRRCVNPEHLRPATNKQNQENRKGTPANNKSGVRGVFFETKKQMWQARVRHNRKQYHAGFFADLSDAEAAVIALRDKLFTHNDLDRLAS